ncbi:MULTISPECIES: bile acid:sodium symporter family protein [unclassified Sphingobium]|uniref:bile acid:sodium symporter family protein n=1 Tax=unclassified Sphingobium TaxID=2611147 RepID=UPI000D159D86|nr:MULTISPECIES: bile acid:sodium symporter family protein [unclassified Sphingobium]MBG6119599.1 sodium/bile acid cotransporter 7 [Sphingobium sp. JAI105]PSO13313.1 bile acid:sodium symporter [Sphingobium sp. AEW4]TWD11548.1 sodium/bile acid cotransporter 7 [Sphingobium sp. AEW010]TWD28561.1 sodium/bile acid cotransporter 7 [Sphingobium sp. AEW013]TWD30090.1 sodium/bile acid cotransporter 7 [Sphingobium sp. AEW001]
MTRLRELIDPFLLLLLGTVALASLLPAHGDGARIADAVADAGIVLLFFLHGAKLSRAAIWDGAKAWRLHLAVLATTFAVFPLLGLASQQIGAVPDGMRAGLLFLTLLPSTVQSSIAFTAIARGNVAAAVVSASFSNLLGIVLTPLLVALLMQRTGSGSLISLASVEGIVLQLLLPFLIGHLARPWIGGFVARHKAMIGRVDRGSILLVVYAAFSAAVVEGLWQTVSAGEMALLAGLCVALLAVVLCFTWGLGRMMGLARAERIVLVFCGSKKSLATGVPMAGLLFPASSVGAILLPVMLFHQIQLMACAVLARRYGAQVDKADTELDI